jgi:hypothetical protein
MNRNTENAQKQPALWRGGLALTTKRAFFIFSLIATAIWAIPVSAEDGHATHNEHAGVAEHDEGGGHEFKNGLALFLGVTNESGHDDEATWGLEYARRLSPRWGVGGLLDYAGGSQRNFVIAPFVYWKPYSGGFTLLLAPGVEYHNGRGETDHHLFKNETASVDEDETYFVLRLGATYWFHVGSRYAIGPTVDLDFVDGEEVWAYGVNFEVMF